MPTYNNNSPIPQTKMGQRLAASGVPVFSGGRDPRMYVGGTSMDPASGQVKPYQQPPDSERQLGQIAGGAPTGGSQMFGSPIGGSSGGIESGQIKNPQFYQQFLGGGQINPGASWAKPVGDMRQYSLEEKQKLAAQMQANPVNDGPVPFRDGGGPMPGGSMPWNPNDGGIWAGPGQAQTKQQQGYNFPNTNPRAFPGGVPIVEGGPISGGFYPHSGGEEMQGGPSGTQPPGGLNQTLVAEPGAGGMPPMSMAEWVSKGGDPSIYQRKWGGGQTAIGNTSAPPDTNPRPFQEAGLSYGGGYTSVGSGPNYYGTSPGGGGATETNPPPPGTNPPPPGTNPPPPAGDDNGAPPGTTDPPEGGGGIDPELAGRWDKIKEWKQSLDPEERKRLVALAKEIPEGGGQRAKWWEEQMAAAAGEDTGDDTAPPEEPKATPYRDKLERRRANRQAKRQARWDRRNGGGGGGGGRVQANQEFGQALYGNTTIPNDAKNAIQGVHEKFLRGEATRQQLNQAIFNSGLPQDLKMRLSQMYGGGGGGGKQASPMPNTQTARAMRGGRRRRNR